MSCESILVFSTFNEQLDYMMTNHWILGFSHHFQPWGHKAHTLDAAINMSSSWLRLPMLPQ
jgi:hypothetical protein